MIHARARSLAALVLGVTVGCQLGCKKDGADPVTGGLPPELRPHPAHVNVGKLTVPEWFASIPTDTPYVVAAFEAVPVAFYARFKDALAPMLGPALGQLRTGAGDAPVLAAVLDELDGKWNQAGFEALGFSAQPRYAVYGLGIQPVVARLEIKDDRAVQATIVRIAGRAGTTLPEPVARGDRRYWRIAASDDTAALIALGDHQLIAALGKAADVDAQLDLILGVARPASNMADGKQLKELMTRHGFGPQAVAFADTHKLASAALQAAGAKPTPLCPSELDQLATRVPRVALGAGEFTPHDLAWGMVVELAPDVAAAARSLQVEIPGLADALSGRPMFAFGGGIDLAAGQELARVAAERLKHLGEACGLPALEQGADQAIQTLSGALPDFAGLLTGGAVALRNIDFGAADPRAGAPRKLDAEAVLASPDARVLFARILALDPQLRQFSFSTDGKLHDLRGSQVPLPIPIAAGVGEKTIVITTGDQRAARGDRLLAARGGKAPLLAFTYDYGGLVGLIHKFGGAALETAPAVRETYDVLGKLLGRAVMTLDVTDHSVALWSSLEVNDR